MASCIIRIPIMVKNKKCTKILEIPPASVNNINTENLALAKFIDGQCARDEWGKEISSSHLSLSIDDYNNACGDVFKHEANIILDSGSSRQTTIQAQPINNQAWKDSVEKVYILTRNGKVIKIGGTRVPMKGRFGSYLCGHHVIERGCSGKMSVTNARIYHTIEKDLLETDSTWCIYTWTLPIVEHTLNILGIETKITCQTFHAYESRCITKFTNITGKIPLLCNNCDPLYK